MIGNRPVSKSLKEYARGITGGLLFSFPLLYTMEVWWAGFSATPIQLLTLVIATYLLLLGYNRYAGMRPGVTWRSVMIDSVEEMGIGLVLSFCVLLVLNRIQLTDMGMSSEMMGKVIIEAMAVSIGVSIGTAQLGADIEEEDNEKLEEEKSPGRLGMIVLAFCGALLIGGNVAPTEEVVMLAVEAEPVHILLMALASLLLSVVVVYFSDFKGTAAKVSEDLLFWLTFDTCVSYLVALLASAFTLWFFGRFDNVSFWTAFSQTIVLGVLSSLGASAGRLLIK
ncbi:TIGR02587 family membrane protein [Pontibacter sp. BT310]|uniref:TIGR02587 family membrane protein n=1 Tax=Pontibacter populi TaxID=890055 RepID=A0ABS6X6F9_9BACT|nr:MULTISPECIES: TIGR02587 family membrane protein [Pontibacter]MBJ6116608.1 TIGR02587 family membrane protein [Pontibacter sp. BT310]MBR0569032.1 TIGR02587 family membrane protein [Microvirga sp. STS03]MBW3363461.1 TIGR02587 family membrane protein [Pontibacter populi]